MNKKKFQDNKLLPGFNARKSLETTYNTENKFGTISDKFENDTLIEPLWGECCDWCEEQGSVCDYWHRCLTEGWSDSIGCYADYGQDCSKCRRSCVPCPL
jgi:hypothetical protein